MNIKIFALILIMGSFLAGAFISVLDPVQVNWSWFVPVLLVGLTGLYLFRKAQHGAARSSELLSGNMQTNNFANARESMKHVFGLQNYADVMSAFAAGERYVNRVWSASTDGYVDEVRNYLNRATEQFREARSLFSKLQNQFQTGHSVA